MSDIIEKLTKKELREICDIGFEVEKYCTLDKKVKSGIITKINYEKDIKLLDVTNFPYQFYLNDNVRFTGKVILTIERYKELLDEIKKSFCQKCHDEGMKEAFEF